MASVAYRRVGLVTAEYSFTARVWLWKGDSAWHFVSLPEEIADEVDEQVQGHSRGFGSVPVEVRGTGVAWRTSLFPDRKSGTFILPLKKQIRQQLDCAEGSSVTLTIKVLDG